jgi:regulatory protein
MYTEGIVSGAVRQLEAADLYERAVRALAQRGRTEAELRRLLTRRAASPAAVEAALARLREYGYLDDARLAHDAARYEHEVFHHGRERARRDLVARGVEEGLAATATQSSYDGVDEQALLAAFIAKKRLPPPSDARRAANAYRKLRLAGFSLEACRRQFSRWNLPIEWLDLIDSGESDF